MITILLLFIWVVLTRCRICIIVDAFVALYTYCGGGVYHCAVRLHLLQPTTCNVFSLYAIRHQKVTGAGCRYDVLHVVQLCNVQLARAHRRTERETAHSNLCTRIAFHTVVNLSTTPSRGSCYYDNSIRHRTPFDGW